MSEDLFKGYGVEITLDDREDFNIVKETLTRMGIASNKNKTLTQSCHIFHRQGRYAIMHFKELLAFDGKQVNLDKTDIARRNLIVKLLNEWDLIRYTAKLEPIGDQNMIRILSSKDKQTWQFVTKYSIGKK